MTEYRMARPGEWDACIEMANYVFSVEHSPTDFEKLLPKVYQAGPEMAGIHRVAVREDGKIVGLIAVLPQTMSVAGKSLRVGYVGTVSVHPKARGEGHMKRMMGDWIRELEGHCDFLVLDGQRQRYGYFGFAQGGMEYEFVVDKSNIRHVFGKDKRDGCCASDEEKRDACCALDKDKRDGCCLSDGAASDRITFGPLFAPEHREEALAFAVRMNEARPAYVVRERDQLEAVLESFCGEPTGVWINGALAGYLIRSGANNIAELAVQDASEIGPIVAAYMRERALDVLRIHVPVYDRAQVAALSAFAEEVRLSNGGSSLYRIFDFANVLEAYLTLKAQTIGISDGCFSAVIEGQPVTVQVTEGKVTVSRSTLPGALQLGREQAQELLLSQTAAAGSHAGISDAVWKTIPRDWFPLPLFKYMPDTF